MKSALVFILSFSLTSLITLGCTQANKDLATSTEGKALEIETKEIPYTYKEVEMIGYLAKPKKANGNRPGVLVVHEWWGQTDYPRERAEMLAREGYVAFAVDMYGNRRIADHPKEAGSFAKATMSNIKDTEAKFMSALSTLQALEGVDSEKIAALGYCYGGGLVLEMSRRGAPLDMVFSYHGTLQGQAKATKARFQPQVFIFNGGADPMVPKEQVKAFEVEMKKADVNYEFHNYPTAVHAFTNPEATKKGKKFNLPLAYDAEADKDSWEKTLKALENL